MADDPDGEGPADAALASPLILAGKQDSLLVVNTCFFASLLDKPGEKDDIWLPGKPVRIQGIAVEDRKVRNKPQSRKWNSFWIDSLGELHIGSIKDPSGIVNGISGSILLVNKGEVFVGRGRQRAPRTAIGLDKSGKESILVVVDGRQKGYSEGMTLNELAEYMKKLGCWNALNFDGGGSSIMMLKQKNGNYKVANSPSTRYMGLNVPRPLPAVLIVRERVKVPVNR